MNKTVSVTGMDVKATAEDGLLIGDSNKANWAVLQNLGMQAGTSLAPTSAAAVASPVFVKNSSDEYDDAKADQASGYTTLNLTWSTETAAAASIGSVTVGSGQSAVTTNYVLAKTFYIKSAGSSDWATSLVIDSVTADVTSTGTDSEDLNNALRVLVVVNGEDAFVYNPLDSDTDTYNWKGTTNDAIEVETKASTEDSTCANVTAIPNINTDDPIEVKMYIYFEGEDAECKSSNIDGITVDDLTVSATFKTVAGGPADT